MSNSAEIDVKDIELLVTPIPPEASRRAQTGRISGTLFSPQEPARIWGGLVLIQEIFGVNPHIRDVGAHYASRGLLVLAPHFFDHIERGVELDYEPSDIARGRELVTELGWNTAVRDVEVSVRELKSRLPPSVRSVAVLGYCWGGSLAFLSACRLPAGEIAGAVSYYGRHIPEFLQEKPHAPLIFHFGESDPTITMENVRKVSAAYPEFPVHTYPAGHGFNCNRRKDHHPESAARAEQRTLEFLRMHMNVK